MTTRVYLGIGSNLNRDNSLRFAFEKVSSLLENVEKSSIWISKPVRKGEPDYFNMVVKGDTSLSLHDFHARLLEIETAAGKEMMFNNGTNFGLKRRLDIDILLFGDTVTTDPCQIPRHDVADYPFVTFPLNELTPDLVHPVLKKTVAQLLSELEGKLDENTKVVKTQIDWNVKAPKWD